jgi:hypothetical protein
MINTTLAAAVRSSAWSAPGIQMPFNLPYMEWDHTSCTATLYADSWLLRPERRTEPCHRVNWESLKV